MARPATRDRWREFNIGPFRVDTDGEASSARETLSNLEQLRWILGGMLENKDLEAVWPFRIIISSSAPAGSEPLVFAHGQYIAAVRPGSEPSYPEVARIFVESNTTRLPASVDSGLPQLFDRMEAHGSQVSWARKPVQPTLNWARVQMFATKREYSGRFRIFLNNLRGGSLLTVAEANAFGKDSKTLESEVAAYYSTGPVDGVTIAARPLDPKHEFGEHPFDPALAQLYLGDSFLASDRQRSDQGYKAAAASGYKAEAQEGIALLVLAENGDPREYLDGAIASSSKSAWVYAKAAESRTPPEASSLLRTARELNPRWWLPPARLAELADKPADKEALLLEACQKDSRRANLWQNLAELQSHEGKASAAQNSWIRAEDSAGSPAEREAIHKRRQSLESQRLDAEEALKRNAAKATQAEDTRLRDEQLARIRAAEQRANTTNSPESPETAQAGVAHWWNAGERPIEAQLVRVDCLGQSARLQLKTGAGKPLSLLVPDPSKIEMDGAGEKQFACGLQQPPRKLSLNYKPRPDKKLGTAGDVVAIHFE